MPFLKDYNVSCCDSTRLRLQLIYKFEDCLDYYNPENGML